MAKKKNAKDFADRRKQLDNRKAAVRDEGRLTAIAVRQASE